jgi:hypothetical protein
MRNVETSYPRLISQAGETVRHTFGGASVRCRKKRRLPCNGVNTGSNFARPERELTSDGCQNLAPGQVSRCENTERITPRKESK